ncbi:hypothetical protein Tco_0111315 [Tanacetum coccineum]
MSMGTITIWSHYFGDPHPTLSWAKITTERVGSLYRNSFGPLMDIPYFSGGNLVLGVPRNNQLFLDLVANIIRAMAENTAAEIIWIHIASRTSMLYHRIDRALYVDKKSASIISSNSSEDKDSEKDSSSDDDAGAYDYDHREDKSDDDEGDNDGGG